MEVLFDSKHCTISYDATVPCLHQVWRGFVSGADLREAHKQLLRLLVHKHLSCVLADTRAMRIISAADQQWIEHEFFPRAIRAGYRRVAVIPSQDLFNQKSVNNIVLEINKNETFQAEQFPDEATARRWLRQTASASSRSPLEAQRASAHGN